MKGKKYAFKVILLTLLCLNITIILQIYVGRQTIYGDEQLEKRKILHEVILKNSLPEGKLWKDYSGSLRVRILVVKLAESIRLITGLQLKNVYITIDTVFLFSCLIGLYLFLNQWLDPNYCLIGILYFGICLVTSYHFHYFHPWDRMSLFSWIVLAFLIKNKKTGKTKKVHRNLILNLDVNLDKQSETTDEDLDNNVSLSDSSKSEDGAKFLGLSTRPKRCVRKPCRYGHPLA